MHPYRFETVYPSAVRAEAVELLTVDPACIAPAGLQASPGLLEPVEVVMSGWGMPRVDEALLASAPNLKLICYAAGSIRYFVTEAMWDRGIRVTHAASQNAVPVAEFTFSHIQLALKHALRMMRACRTEHAYPREASPHGTFGSRVGVVSLGLIGRLVVERVRTLEVETVVYDIRVDEPWAKKAGVTHLPLEELFATCDVVSLHTPLLDATRGMIDEPLLRSMKRDATLINTARGAVIDESALVRVLRDRPDLTAVLDVTHPEPPPADSPLWELENVFVFPHIAGAMGPEHGRMGRAMVDELRRYLAGEPLRYEVTRESMATMA